MQRLLCKGNQLIAHEETIVDYLLEIAGQNKLKGFEPGNFIKFMKECANYNRVLLSLINLYKKFDGEGEICGEIICLFRETICIPRHENLEVAQALWENELHTQLAERLEHFSYTQNFRLDLKYFDLTNPEDRKIVLYFAQISAPYTWSLDILEKVCTVWNAFEDKSNARDWFATNRVSLEWVEKFWLDATFHMLENKDNLKKFEEAQPSCLQTLQGLKTMISPKIWLGIMVMIQKHLTGWHVRSNILKKIHKILLDNYHCDIVLLLLYDTTNEFGERDYENSDTCLVVDCTLTIGYLGVINALRKGAPDDAASLLKALDKYLKSNQACRRAADNEKLFFQPLNSLPKYKYSLEKHPLLFKAIDKFGTEFATEIKKDIYNHSYRNEWPKEKLIFVYQYDFEEFLEIYQRGTRGVPYPSITSAIAELLTKQPYLFDSLGFNQKHMVVDRISAIFNNNPVPQNVTDFEKQIKKEEKSAKKFSKF